MKTTLFAVVAFIAMFSFCGEIFSQESTNKPRLPFPNENISCMIFGGITLENALGLESQITGVLVKLRQETKSGRSFFGGGALLMKGAYKNDEVFVYDTRYGGGLSFSFGRKTGWTDLDIQFQRIDRKGEVRHTNITWKEKINIVDVSLIIDWRKDFVDGFSLARTKLYFEYIYPLGGEKQIFDNGVAGSKEEPSEIKSLYFKVEPTWYNKRLGASWALTAFFLGGYDYQCWNSSDNYIAGFGGRLYKKDFEILTLSFELRFKSSGPNSGEPRLNGCFNFMPLVKNLF